MKYIKSYKERMEDSKLNNIQGDLITIDNVVSCIANGGYVYSNIIKGLPDNDPEEPLKALSIDEDGLVTIDFEGIEYEIPIKNITKIT